MTFVTCPIRRYHPAVVAQKAAYFEVPHARLYDLPDEGVPIGVAASGRQSCQIAGQYADALIAVEPDPALPRAFDESGGAGKPRYGQVPVCCGDDVDDCRGYAREQWRWGTLTWPVMSNLPDTTAFDRASRTVRAEDVSELAPCGPDLDTYVAAVRRYLDAGFTHVALVQVGADRQAGFLVWAQDKLLPALREL